MKVFIHGATGRVGKLILAESLKEEDIEIGGLFYKSTSHLPKEYEKLKIDNIESIKNTNCDCIIDFSVSGATETLVNTLRNNPKPLVIGTTDLSESTVNTLHRIAEKVPVFLSGNFSFGIAILDSILREYSKKMANFDIEIIETHHKKKLDAPSGTAIGLAETINESLDEHLKIVYDRNKNPIKRQDIGIQSIRGGDIVGKHEVTYFGDGEFLEFSHTALNRKLYASGALQAAKFIKDKPAGMYGMKDIASI